MIGYPYPHERGLVRFVALDSSGSRLGYLDATPRHAQTKGRCVFGPVCARVLTLADYLSRGMS